MQLQPPSTTGFSGSGNPFLDAFDSVTKYMGENKFQTAALATTGLGYTGAFKPPGTPMPEKRQYKGQYSLSPNFQATSPEPNVYQEKRYNYALGGITSLQGGGPVERMSMMNTAMNPQGGLYPQGMIDKTQYATPTQRPVSSEMVDEAPAYERSSPMLMAGGGQIPISLQGSVNLNPNNTASQGFSGAATSGPGMAPQAVFPGGPGGIGMQPQLAVMPRTMAGGGIASFAKGTPREKDPEADFARYYALMEGQAPEQPPAPSYVGRVGIAYDDDQDTRYQDPLTAALIRQGKASKRAGIAGPVIPRPKPLGVVNFAPAGTQQAASGGIMGYNLGGYADGGNPRLLKGPGDGMSDNIPAVIGRRQPARLADGEFVVPADVVSHLGNGSTDAGAKKLHEMMDKVRVARTGKKKQAPAVKAKKYIPK
jgi:hypothetical protein